MGRNWWCSYCKRLAVLFSNWMVNGCWLGAVLWEFRCSLWVWILHSSTFRVHIYMYQQLKWWACPLLQVEFKSSVYLKYMYGIVLCKSCDWVIVWIFPRFRSWSWSRHVWRKWKRRLRSWRRCRLKLTSRWCPLRPQASPPAGVKPLCTFSMSSFLVILLLCWPS